MILEISADIPGAIDGDPADVMDLIDALEMIAQSRRLGYLLLVGRRDTLEALAGSASLSQVARGVFTRAANRVTQNGELWNTASRVIVAGPPGSLRERSTVGHTVRIRVPLDDFRTFDAAHRVVLLAENILDTRLYVKAAETFAAARGFGRPHLAYEPRGGGGGNLAAEYCSLQQNTARSCVCICDSDRKAPGGPLGGTASAVRGQDDPNRVRTEVIVLDEREAENVLPSRTLREARPQDPIYGAAVVRLELVEASTAPELRGYCDLKRGTTLADIFDLPPASAPGVYWRQRLNDVRTAVSNPRQECFEDAECQSPGACSCGIVLGFGNSLLEHALEVLEKEGGHATNRALCALTRPAWESVGGVVFSWLCAATAMVA